MILAGLRTSRWVRRFYKVYTPLQMPKEFIEGFFQPRGGSDTI
jgi:hypothetical protein